MSSVSPSIYCSECVNSFSTFTGIVSSLATSSVCVVTCSLQCCETIARANIASGKPLSVHYWVLKAVTSIHCKVWYLNLSTKAWSSRHRMGGVYVGLQFSSDYVGINVLIIKLQDLTLSLPLWLHRLQVTATRSVLCWWFLYLIALSTNSVNTFLLTYLLKY